MILRYLSKFIDPYRWIKMNTKAGKSEQLIHPCMCSGSLKYVHKSWLETWLTLHSLKELRFQDGDEDFLPELSVPSVEWEIWKFQFKTHLKMKSLKSILDKFIEIMNEDQVLSGKYLFYILYLYLFWTRTFSIAKILMIVMIKHSKNTISKLFSAIYLFLILAYMAYGLQKEGINIRNKMLEFIRKYWLSLEIDLEDQ